MLDLYSIVPVDRETLIDCARATGGRFLTVEDHYAHGGIGDTVLSALAIGRRAGSKSSPYARFRAAANRRNSSIISGSEYARLSKRPKQSSADQSDAEFPSGLNQIPLLKILSAQDRQQVLGEMTETRYGRGQYIFREGDPTEYFHIVKEGSVKCVKSSLDGKECTLKVLMPGDFFCCDASTFDGASHPGTAQPMGDVSVLRMKKEAYFKMLRRKSRCRDGSHSVSWQPPQ